MAERILVLLVLLAGAFLVTRWVSRRRGAVAAGVPSGLTLVVASDCSTCRRAIEALDRARAAYRIVDVGDAAGFGVRSMTVPYAFVGTEDGTVDLVRRGHAVVDDAARLARASRPV